MVRFTLAILLLVTLAACRMQQTEVVFDLGPLGNAMKACTDGDADQCFTAGEMMERGVDGEVSHEGAFNMYEKGCALGDARSCNNAGVKIRELERPNALEKAAMNFERACDGGSAPGCHNLAQAVADGAGVEADLERAEELATRACEAGSPGGCVNAGLWHLERVGTPQGGAVARDHLALACAMDEGLCYFLGVSLVTGTTGSTDRQAGADYIHRSCAASAHEACVALAFHAVGGRVTLPEGAPAVPDLLTSACEGGFVDGCRAAAQVYREGIGVPVDLEQARTWARRACELGDAVSCETP